MKKTIFTWLLASALVACTSQLQETYYEKQVAFPADATPEQKVDMISRLVPTPQQLEWQQMEFTAFLHFGMNTFTGNEWGSGKDSPELFNPSELDCEQWVKALKDGGFKMALITAKHHDGFCLWPTATTEYSVKNSPWKDGKGDVVRELRDACEKYGMKFGVYLSPWDRNCRLYGQGKAYDDFFVAQLTELLTNYGEIFTVWFDGACGEGENGKKQYYDWERYYAVIRELQPNACINVCGPDIRWCGNEAGYTRRSEWSVVPARTRDTEKIAQSSQHEDNEEFRKREIHAWDGDLGSRDILRGETDLVWYPAETNTSIRPGWFYHQHEDDKVRPLEELINIYNSTVGGNSTFLLNIPPTPDGVFHENDVKRLMEMGDYLRRNFSAGLLDKAAIFCRASLDGYCADNVRTDDYDTYFRTADGITEATIEISWDTPVEIGNIVLKENIRLSQRIESFVVTAYLDGVARDIYHGTVVGYKRIIPSVNVKADKLTIRITDSRVAPTLSFIGVYRIIS